MGRGGGSEFTAYVELDSLLGLDCGEVSTVPSAISLYLASVSQVWRFLIIFSGLSDQLSSLVVCQSASLGHLHSLLAKT